MDPKCEKPYESIVVDQPNSNHFICTLHVCVFTACKCVEKSVIFCYFVFLIRLHIVSVHEAFLSYALCSMSPSCAYVNDCVCVYTFFRFDDDSEQQTEKRKHDEMRQTM